MNEWMNPAMNQSMNQSINESTKDTLPAFNKQKNKIKTHRL